MSEHHAMGMKSREPGDHRSNGTKKSREPSHRLRLPDDTEISLSDNEFDQGNGGDPANRVNNVISNDTSKRDGEMSGTPDKTVQRTEATPDEVAVRQPPPLPCGTVPQACPADRTSETAHLSKQFDQAAAIRRILVMHGIGEPSKSRIAEAWADRPDACERMTAFIQRRLDAGKGVGCIVRDLLDADLVAAEERKTATVAEVQNCLTVRQLPPPPRVNFNPPVHVDAECVRRETEQHKAEVLGIIDALSDVDLDALARRAAADDITSRYWRWDAPRTYGSLTIAVAGLVMRERGTKGTSSPVTSERLPDCEGEAHVLMRARESWMEVAI